MQIGLYCDKVMSENLGTHIPKELSEPFTYNGEEGYHIIFTDYGHGGLVVQLSRPNAPEWDKIAGIHLPNDIADSFLKWVAKTAGRAAMVLPPETTEVLKGILAQTKGNQNLPKSDRKVLKEAVRVLENIFSDDVSLERRALNPRHK